MITKYIAVALLTLTLSLGIAQAQRGPIYSANSTPIGRVTDEGDILGSNGILLGSLSKSGIIYNADSTPIGRITDEGDILGSNGILIATVPDSRIGALISLHVLNLK